MEFMTVDGEESRVPGLAVSKRNEEQKSIIIHSENAFTPVNSFTLFQFLLHIWKMDDNF